MWNPSGAEKLVFANAKRAEKVLKELLWRIFYSDNADGRSAASDDFSRTLLSPLATRPERELTRSGEKREKSF
jgi:hypothetical protein